MKTYNNPTPKQYKTLCERPQFVQKSLIEKIKAIFDLVENSGDQALIKLTETFDNVSLKHLKVSQNKLKKSLNNEADSLIKAILQAKTNISTFHKLQKSNPIHTNIGEGIQLGQKSVPIERIGIYIPSGTAPLLSTILMLAIPAKIAGCKEIALCSPPSTNGDIHPSILATAKLLGISEVYRIGGAQAIAAMTLGTDSIKKVSKIFGPGNQYVTAAKSYATNYGVSIDIPAGPSELLVFAGKDSIPEFIAADLLSQAEHGIDSQVVVVSTDPKLTKAIQEKLKQQIKSLPRKDIAKKALQNSISVNFKDSKTAFDFINEYAPEHLIIAGKNATNLFKKVKNAGSVFLGNYCPESAGDYASGTNHTLPTNGWAKSASGVNLDAFVKKITYQKISKRGLKQLAQSITTIARTESLEAHARAVDIRLNQKKNESWK